MNRSPGEARALIGRWFLALLAVLTAIGVFIPSNPVMPTVRLDAAWEYVMNEAVARHLSFGRDIIFTYGPYAAVSTVSYDPATAGIMLWGSLILGICYAVLLARLVTQAPPWAGAALIVYLACGLYNREALLLSYPLLLAIHVIRFSDGLAAQQTKPPLLLQLLTALALIPPGLLPLIKGTYFILSGFTVLWLTILFFLRRQDALTLAALLIPALSCVSFWTASGQAISMLPHYLASMALVVAGYSEALAVQLGAPTEMFAYLAAAIAIILAIALTRIFHPM